jgi:hypothetical protein
MNQKQFDVFLCHNSLDKPLVIEIADALMRRGLKPWIDKSDIKPGAEYIIELNEGILQSKSAAIFLGSNGIGKWQRKEIFVLQQQNADRDMILIPVLLPGVSKTPDENLLLQVHNWLPLESKKITEEFLDKFVMGMKKPLHRITIPPDDLSSDKGIDYTQLRDLLKEENWEKADEETLKVMLKVAGREAEKWLDRKSIEHFPCTDLRTIDKLWKRYSSGHFGFSVQRSIWDEEGENYTKFCDRVGWKVKGKLIDYPKDVKFSTSAPRGHLPAKAVLDKLPLEDYLGIRILGGLTRVWLFVLYFGILYIIGYLLDINGMRTEERPMYGQRWTPLASRLKKCNI